MADFALYGAAIGIVVLVAHFLFYSAACLYLFREPCVFGSWFLLPVLAWGLLLFAAIGAGGRSGAVGGDMRRLASDQKGGA